jgi:hypothetical protein
MDLRKARIIKYLSQYELLGMPKGLRAFDCPVPLGDDDAKDSHHTAFPETTIFLPNRKMRLSLSEPIEFYRTFSHS